jgi:peptidoglycan/xylan/chitin deacetylase (PgdA/CDA1 family)
VSALKSGLRRLAETALAPVAPLSWRLKGSGSLLVLMYHRVLPAGHPDRATEQPGMYVSPETLALHLRVLKNHFSLVHLDDWLAAAERGAPLPARACALTFDDGWRDNFEYAFPVLREYQAPATIFLVSGMTGTARDFWPNRLARMLAGLAPGEALPQPLQSVLAELVSEARQAGGWDRDRIDRAIVRAKQLGEEQIQALLDDVAIGDARAVLDENEVRAMAASGLIRFGSHTRNHLRFRGEQPQQILESEIGGSRVDIAQCAGAAAVGLFCYPNGDTTPAAVGVVRQHYRAAVTTQPGWHRAGADPFLIRRVGVHDDISSRPAAFLARISGLL